MKLLVLALCAGLAAALPTSHGVGDNAVDTGSQIYKASSQEVSHASEEASYFYSQDGETILEITVQDAPRYGLECFESKQLVKSAEVIVQETVDEEAEAAAAAAAASSAAASSSTGVGAAASSAAGDGAAASSAAGEGAAASSAAGVGAAASSAAGEGAAASSAAGEGAAASSAADEGAAASSAAGEGAAASSAAGEGVAASSAAGEGGAASSTAGEGAAASSAAGEGAAASSAAGEGAAASSAVGEGAAASSAAGEGAASSATTGEGAAASASTGTDEAVSTDGEISVEESAAIYVEEGPDEFDRCICVPYYLCREENIISDGSGQINIRFGADGSAPTNTKCLSFDSVCCLAPESRPLAEIVDEYLSEPYQPSCGRRNPQGFGITIEGYKDSEAQFGEYPSMAIILEEDVVGGVTQLRYVCGGSLITPGVILTAAHCVAGKDASKLLVRLGDWNTKSETELLPYQQIRVARSVVHERFNPRSLFNTVALLFLESEAELQPHIDTICLPTPDQVSGLASGVPFYDPSRCIATGFGRERFEGGEYQNIMKQVDLAEVEHDDCQDKLRKTRLGRWFRLHKSFTCAGGKPGVDTCTGDGGSQLICPLLSDPQRYAQMGIVAWGIGCGQRGVPGVYGSVIELLPWIQEKLSAQPGHTVEELVERHEAVQVCVTKNPLVQYQETIPIRVGPPPEQHHEVQQVQTGY